MSAMDSALLERIENLASQRDAAGSESRALSFLDMSLGDQRRYSLTAAIRCALSAMDPASRVSGIELEADKAIRKRIGAEVDVRDRLIPGGILIPREVQSRMSTSNGPKGGYAVGNQHIGFTDALRARSVVMRMGARTLSDLKGNITAGRQTGTVTATWQGPDGTSVSAGDQALGQLSMEPHAVIAITDVSEQLVMQTSPSVDNFFALDLASAVGTAVDKAALVGAGGAEPLGIKNTNGIVGSQDLGTASYAKAQAIVQAAAVANAIRGNPGWVTTSTGAGICMARQRFTGTDSPIWEGNILDGELVGFPAMSSEQMPSANTFFGSWDELVIGDWGVLEIAADRGGTRFNNGQVGIRAMWMVDVMLRFPASFYVSTNIS